MSEKKQESQPVLKKDKKKRTKIIAGFIGGAVLVGGTIAGGIELGDSSGHLSKL